MAKKVTFSNGDFTKDSMIGVGSISSKGVIVKDNSSAMITNIIEPDEVKRYIIREEIEKIVDASEAGGFYQPDWEKLLKDEDL
ncbi:MAG: hypothetical protein V5789_05145 [Colwellia sp.]